jgi:hypothetical protein
MAQNILGCAGKAQTRGPCLAYDLGTMGRVTSHGFRAVIGLAQLENGM